MRHTVFAALAAGALALSAPVYAHMQNQGNQPGGMRDHNHGDMNHEEHHKQHQGAEHGAKDGGHDHGNACETVVPQSAVTIPNYRDEHWKLVKSVTKVVDTDMGKRQFVYDFFKDSRQANAKVTLMKASVPILPQGAIETIAWEVGDKKMVTSLNSGNKDVCVAPLYGSDGKRYDIEGFMEKVSAWANK